MTEASDQFGTIDLYCDYIGCDSSEQFEGFDNKVDFTSMSRDARASGWKILTVRGTWHHLCPKHSNHQIKL